MNLRERFLSIMDFEPPDRPLLWEWGYWGGTLERWYTESLPRIHGLCAAGKAPAPEHDMD